MPLECEAGSLADRLRKPETWPVPHPTRVDLIETHVSWVLRADHEVFKIKKPVALGFLDFRSVERRREACEQEVRLNARLAPGIYRGVVPVVRRADGSVELSIPSHPTTLESSHAGRASDGEIVDWAVRMVRLQDAERADALLSRDELTAGRLETIAQAMADLHARSVVPPGKAAQLASPEAIARNVRDNFDQVRDKTGGLVDERVAREVEQRQIAFVRDRAPLLRARLADRICDGHGDLRLEHVYFTPQGLRIIDCIEFDERYRIADACADVAFLAMDLASAGHERFAERFLGRYARAAQDYDLYTLVDFYESYRAWIRGKVAIMLAEDPGASEHARAQSSATARKHFLQAQACERARLLSPTLVCVGGVVASGKSTVADALADEIACPVVDSDRTRKGLSRTEPSGNDAASADADRSPAAAWQGAYDPAVTDRVYTEVFRRASAVLSSGRSVVVDASFRAQAEREHARSLARFHKADFLFVHCRAPLEICRARLARRQGGPSEAHLAMFDAFAKHFEPVRDIPAAQLVKVDTTTRLGQNVQVVLDRIAVWPRGLR